MTGEMQVKKGGLPTLVQRLLRTAGQAGVVAGVVGVITFLMMRALPGDAAYRVAAGRYGYDLVDAAAAEAVRRELGLDLPAWQQLGRWLLDLVQLRLGNSMVSGESVWHELSHHLQHTLYLGAVAWALSIAIGVSLGTVAALQGGWIARCVDNMSTFFKATPAFLIGLMLTTVLAVQLQWLPVAGHGEVQYVILPALCLALALSAGLAQLVQAQLSHILRSDYFEFALTKGLPMRAAIWRHAARNLAVPVLAYAGVQLVLLVEGVVVVETMFAWPGIGHALVHATFGRDVPMIQGAALAMAMLFVLLNALLDVLHSVIDPRLSSLLVTRTKRGGQ